MFIFYQLLQTFLSKAEKQVWFLGGAQWAGRRRQWQPTPALLPGESYGRGSCWFAVYGVAQSWTRLKWLSSSSSSISGQEDDWPALWHEWQGERKVGWRMATDRWRGLYWLHPPSAPSRGTTRPWEDWIQCGIFTAWGVLNFLLRWVATV